MKTLLKALLAVTPLLIVGAVHAQAPKPPVMPDMNIDGMAVQFTCLGPGMVKQMPQTFYGADSTLGRVSAAWCDMPNGERYGWYTVRPPGSAMESLAPPIWLLTSVSVRDGEWTVWPSTLADKSRSAYGILSDGRKLWLGPVNGQRAAAGAACACDKLAVDSGGYSYCPYAPTMQFFSLAVCKRK